MPSTQAPPLVTQPGTAGGVSAAVYAQEAEMSHRAAPQGAARAGKEANLEKLRNVVGSDIPLPSIFSF